MIEEMSPGEIDALMARQVVGRIGCHVDGKIYVVPVIYAWDAGYLYVYSVEGQKISMMRENPEVCFEIDEYQSGGGWQSVIIQGRYEELVNDQAARTLRLLSERFASRNTSERQRPKGEGRTPVAFRIQANEITGRKVERSAKARARLRIGLVLARRNARRSAASVGLV